VYVRLDNAQVHVPTNATVDAFPLVIPDNATVAHRLQWARHAVEYLCSKIEPWLQAWSKNSHEADKALFNVEHVRDTRQMAFVAKRLKQWSQQPVFSGLAFDELYKDVQDLWRFADDAYQPADIDIRPILAEAQGLGKSDLLEKLRARLAGLNRRWPTDHKPDNNGTTNLQDKSPTHKVAPAVKRVLRQQTTPPAYLNSQQGVVRRKAISGAS
jgi:hypothetical protein